MRILNFDYPVTETTYKVVGERALKLYTFQPEGSREDKSALLFVNGGSFAKGSMSPTQFQHQANYFSSLGLVSICVDYRNAYDEGFLPSQAICDVRSAIQWVRRNSSDLGIDANKIIVCGASSGGYSAVSSIMFEHVSDEPDETNSNPNALVIFAAGMDGEEIMGRLFPDCVEGAFEVSPLHNIKKCLPETLWLCGTADLLYEQNKSFVDLMVSAGNDISFVTYEGMEHGFHNYGRHDNKPYMETILRIEEFLKTKGYI